MSSNTVLLVVDVQLGLFEDFGPLYQGEEVISTIRRLSAEARSAEVPVIYIQHCGNEGESLDPATAGWRIHPELTPASRDVVIQKRTPDSFKNTDLRRELENRGIKRLVVTGLQTEYCVDTLCRGAFGLGYDVVLVKDAHTTFDSETLTAQEIIAHHNTVLGNWFAELKEASQIVFRETPQAMPSGVSSRTVEPRD
jgi:nicotinamidase-related amidase